MYFIHYFLNEIDRSLGLISLILAIVSFTYLKSKNKSNIFLSLLFLILSLNSFFQFSFLSQADKYIIAFFFGLRPTLYLFHPLCYLYIRSMLHNKVYFNKWDILLFLPFILFLIDTIPYQISSFEYKLKLAELYIKDFDNVYRYPIALFFTAKFNFFFRPIFNFIITVFEMRLIYKHFKNYPEHKVNFKTTYYWLWSFAFTVFFITTVLSVATVFILISPQFNPATDKTVANSIHLANFISLIFIVYILLSTKTVYGITPEYDSEDEIIIVKESNKIGFKLEENRLIEIDQILQKYFEEEKPYLDETFTLLKLSESLKIPNHHLSYYFNFHLKKKFTDYKNEWRINHAIQLLMDGMLKKYTVEQVYQEAGFTTKSNFYRAFRNQTGKTPIEYLDGEIEKKSKI